MNILKNAKKLKGNKIFIENDYSRQTLRKRKLLLRESAKPDKDSGKDVYLLNDTSVGGGDVAGSKIVVGAKFDRFVSFQQCFEAWCAEGTHVV